MSQLGVPSAVGSPRKPTTRALPKKPLKYSRPLALVRCHRFAIRIFFGSALIYAPLPWPVRLSTTRSPAGGTADFGLGRSWRHSGRRDASRILFQAHKPRLDARPPIKELA